MSDEKTTTAGRLADTLCGSQTVVQIRTGEVTYMVSDDDKLVIVNALLLAHTISLAPILDHAGQ